MSIICSRIGIVILAGTLSVAIFASARAASHSVLYSFGVGGDGTGPAASLTNIGGVLYGTTYGGGAHGPGAVFRVSTAGAEKLVYSFRNGTDGANPKSPVLNLGGMLYGTTQYGGSSACTGGCGTVFAVTPAGEETMLYAFKGGADGANPTAGLINVGGILYGTTSYGGAHNYGTVFTITRDGAEHVLYSFKGGTDGGNPMGRLLKFYGMLYGTTYTGGANHYYGTVFAITPDGVKEKVVYSFKDGSDGAYPTAGLVSIGQTFYGTSSYGAAHLGTVFSVTPAGSFKVLHSFRGGKDGSEPQGDLINLAGTLYGVTYQGGGTGCFDRLGCGAVFSVTPGKVGTVVYSFKGGSDGLNPDAGLTNIGGLLFGTTASGGTYFNGTVFVITR
jgi:uncharacterized repeat protein (TIGR03803 family)